MHAILWSVGLFVAGVLVVLGVAAAGASAVGTESGMHITPTPVIPEMRLLVKDGGSSCADGVCIVGTGREFTLSVDIVTAPSEGYTGVQSWVNFGNDLLYKPSETPLGEIVWPACSASAAFHPSTAESVSHGCLTGLLPPLLESMYIGNFVDLSLHCSSEPSSTLVRLVPLGDEEADTSGSGFATLDGQVAANVSDLTIDCLDGLPTFTPTPTGQPTSTPTSPAPGETPGTPTATPTLLPGAPSVTPGGTLAPTATIAPGTTPVATATAGPGATSTPAPDGVVGDASCDGRVDPLDAALILQLSAGLIGVLPCPAGGDPSGDGVTNPLDAALVLQFSAGLISTLPP